MQKTNGNGSCKTVYDTTAIYFTPAPIVDAGSAVACAGNSGIPLNGVSTIDGVNVGGRWSTSGEGTFSPNDTTLNASYFLDEEDIEHGDDITLYLLSLNNGTCGAVIDSIVLNLRPAPLAIAGNDTLLCKDNAVISLDGDYLVAGGAVWDNTLGTGLISGADSVSATATYTFMQSEYDSNYVDLVLETTLNGICAPSYDTLRVNFY